MQQDQINEHSNQTSISQSKSNYLTRGRPTVMTDDVLNKLEQAFALGCSDTEAIYYAGIGRTAFYQYQKENPEFEERKEELKNKPVLMARQTVLKGITGYELKDDNGKVIKVINAPDPKLAMDYLKLKQHNEFKSGIAIDNKTLEEQIEDARRMMMRFAEYQPIQAEIIEETPQIN